MDAHIQSNRLKKDVRALVSITVLLILIGLMFIYSSSSVFALEQFGSAHYFLKKQAFYLIPSVFVFIFFAKISLSLLRRLVPYMFLFALLLTGLTLIPGLGSKINGSNRWLMVAGISIQPSELLKFFLIMYVAFFLEKKQKTADLLVKNYLKLLVILGVAFLLLLKQPDFGSVVTILVTVFALFFVAEFKPIHLGLTVLGALPFVSYLVLMKSYRLNRILIFMNPWVDPQGRGFQIIQSLIAIGSGSVWGVGISNSKQKFFYLPMQHTDFIFPIIAEETGFVGSFVLILLFVAFCFKGLRIALALEKPFSFFCTLGFVVLLSLQAVINLMVTTGLLPTKGLGLPLVSYGGTSLVSFCAMIGLIVNFASEEF